MSFYASDSDDDDNGGVDPFASASASVTASASSALGVLGGAPLETSIGGLGASMTTMMRAQRREKSDHSTQTMTTNPFELPCREDSRSF